MKIPPRSVIWLSLGLACTGAGLYFLLPALLGTSVTPLAVTRGEIVQTIVASGRAETPFGLEIGSQVIGNVTRVLVEEGATIRKGDVLITLDDSQKQASVDQARATVLQARTSLAQLTELTLPVAEQTLIETRATALNARTQLARTLQLAERAVATGQTVENMQRAYDVAATSVRSAELAVRSASPGGSAHQAALAGLAQSQAALRVAEAQLRLATITAPISGVVIARHVEAGAVVQAGAPLLVLAPQLTKELVVQIDERNLGLIVVGQSALASADAYPDATFDAVLSAINPAIDADRGSVEVKLAVPVPPAYLKENMTVSVNIEVVRHKDALVVPNEAVRNAASLTPLVLIASDGVAVERPVILGAHGIDKVEVLKGLAAGDLVIAASGSSIKAGQRVRVVRPEGVR